MQNQTFKQAIVAMAAGILGLMSGSVVAAVINLDDDATMKATPVANYAVETLSKEATRFTVGEDKATYYHVTDSGGWTVTGAVGISGGAGTMVVRFSFENLVFVDPPMADIAGGGTMAALTTAMAGTSQAVYTVDGHAVTSVITLTLGDTVAISPTAPVTVTMIVRPELFADIVGEHEIAYRSAITVGNGLSMTKKAKSPTASVIHRFRRFKDDDAPTDANMGSITIDLATGVLNAVNSQAATLTDLIAPGTPAIGNTPAGGTLLSLVGDFSFAKGVSLQVLPDPDTNMCAAVGTEVGGIAVANLLERDADTMVVMPIVNQTIAVDDTYTRRLCVHVYDPEDMKSMVIPTTDAYVAMVNVAPALAANAFLGARVTQLELGRILRDGTTAHIPYLSTYEGYNHRITLSNRGSREADYEFTFRPEEGVTATPGMYAEGTLAAGETMILKAVDVVSLSGGKRTAATVTVVASPSQIDVSTTLVNRATGTAVVTWAEKD